MEFFNKLQNILQNNQNLSAFQIEENQIFKHELYYVLDKIETAKVVNTKHVAVIVYKDWDQYRGSSTFVVDESMSDEELNDKINEACKRSLYVKNKYFPLPEYYDRSQIENSLSNLGNENLADICAKVSKAIFKANVYTEGWINSTEIFVTKTWSRFCNSNGIDVAWPSYEVNVEVIPTWKGVKEEVELYFASRTNDISYDKITEDVNSILMQAKNRGQAVTLPDDLSECDVILQDGEVSEIFWHFASEMSYGLQYRKMSHYKLDDEIQTSESPGDQFNLEMVPSIKGSATSKPIDELGVQIKPVKIIENGKYINMYGDYKNGYYLGVFSPTGNLKNVKVASGDTSYEQMTKTNYLLVQSFSAFQLDSYSGYYGGEVRLGMYYDGKTLTPVTGFSVTGDIHNDKDKMRLSLETTTKTGYSGPKYLKVKMTISK